MNNFYFERKDEVSKVIEAFSIGSVTSLFFFLAFFFTIGPSFVYFFAKYKLGD